MSRPTVHTVHLYAHWDASSSDCCKFTCPACANQLMAKRPPAAEPGVVAHFFQPCVYCGVATSLTIQGYSPNPTGEAPASVVPEELRRSAEAPAATRPEPSKAPTDEHQGLQRLRTIKKWRKHGALNGTYLNGLTACGAVGLYKEIHGQWPEQGEDGSFLFNLDDLKEMEDWLMEKLGQ